jgi:hypothetical protein
LRGTGAALETATDLVAVRNSLIAPVKGLGLAFGTSVAGVAASAALGLLSALCRRERVQVAQLLDARIATTLRVFSVAHQREESLSLLQRQADLMPALVDGLQVADGRRWPRQADASNARLLASQERFQGQAETAYAGLAPSVDRTLQASLDRRRAHRRRDDPPRGRGHAGRHRARDRRAARRARRHDAGPARPAVHALRGAARGATCGRVVARTIRFARHALLRGRRPGRAPRWPRPHERFAETFEARSAHLAGVTRAAVAQHVRMSHAGQAPRRVASNTLRLAAAHEVPTPNCSRPRPRATSSASRRWRNRSRPWPIRCSSRWQQAGAQSLAQQQRVVETMERTARDITVQAETQARGTIAEIGRLVQAASEAPRAAAEVISELRQKLSDSMARDNTMLDERARILETLGTLLDGVNQAASEQRGAIDALVTSSAAVLERVGARFTEQVHAETGKLADVAAQVTGGAAAVAGLGEAFGAAVRCSPSPTTAWARTWSASTARSARRWRAATSSSRTTWRRRAR